MGATTTPTLSLIIFGTHNLQTFKHNTLANKLLLMQFYLINIVLKCITKIDENYASFCLVNMSTVPNFLHFTINAVLHPTFIRKHCYNGGTTGGLGGTTGSASDSQSEGCGFDSPLTQ